MTPKQFRTARAKLRLSVNELADKLQINPRTVRRYQKDSTGRDHWPVPRTVEMSMQKLLTELPTYKFANGSTTTFTGNSKEKLRGFK